MTERERGAVAGQGGKQRVQLRRFVWMMLGVLGVLAVLFLLTGCGAADQVGVASAGVARPTDTTTTVATGGVDTDATLEGSSPVADPGSASTNSDTTDTAGSSLGVSEIAAPLFAEVSAQLDPIPVYAPTYLPPGAAPADKWWPVTEVTSPSEYSGPPMDNPRIDSADGVAVSAQIVTRIDTGWVVFLENFRGDLGDVKGNELASVQGHRAMGYSLQRGFLVQWSDGGRWYGVFGRDVDQALVERIAAGMVRVSSKPDNPK
jgi:hypothetical protein